MHPHLSAFGSDALVLAGVVIATNVAAAEPAVFHTAHFSDDVVISLSLVGDSQSADRDYDFDVLIGLTTISPDGRIIYADPSRHPARVRCGDPAKILVGGIEYPVGETVQGTQQENWKRDLWHIVCKALVS
jgi:hypothetical protein